MDHSSSNEKQCTGACERHCPPKASEQAEPSGLRRKFIEYCDANPDASECRMYEC
jgi:hypothetical protein